jgi:ABC-2 type transport system ATP-binding protein
MKNLSVSQDDCVLTDPLDTDAQAGDASIARDSLALDIQAVSKRYRKHIALDEVSLSVKPAETLAIIGPNGAGKTTLLRLMLNFSQPDSGSIRIFDVPSTDPASRKPVAFLPERFAPGPDLTGAEVIELLGDLRDAQWSQTQRDQVLNLLDFPHAAITRPTKEYSKGMLQKVGLAVALLSDAALTVLDEPMSGLDPVARRTMITTLGRFREERRTLIFTTHTLHDLEHLCDRMAVIHRGRLRFLGSPAAFGEQFEGDLEASFIACLAHADRSET